MSIKSLVVLAITLCVLSTWDAVNVQASYILTSAYNMFQDEGTPIAKGTIINCVGAGIACTTAGSVTTMTVAGAAAGGANRGVFASLPTCNAGVANTVYYSTDAGLNSECNGTSWFHLYDHIPVVPTTTSGSSIWLNQNTGNAQATITNNVAGSGVILTSGSSATAIVQARLRTVPATPYTYIVCGSAMTGAQFAEYGLVWTDGSDPAASKISIMGSFAFNASSNSAPMVYEKYTNSTTLSGSYSTAFGVRGNIDQGFPKCYALVDNGTNRKIGWSLDKINWNQGNYAAVANTDFLTPTHIGYAVNSNNSQALLYFNVFSEEVLASALF